MKCEIKRVKNGWIFTYQDPENDEIIVGEETDDEAECFVSFLRTINEYFGPSSSKYSVKRVRILAMPGSDYMGDLDEEYLESLRWLYGDLKHFVKRKRTGKSRTGNKESFKEDKK